MKKYIILALLIGAFLAFNNKGWSPIRVFNRFTELSADGSKILRDTATISNGSGAVIDISSAGFTAPPAVQAIAVKNTADSMQVPNVAIKSVTTSQVVLNVTEANVGAYVEVNGLGLGLIKVMQAGASPIKFVRTPTIIHLQCTGK